MSRLMTTSGLGAVLLAAALLSGCSAPASSGGSDDGSAPEAAPAQSQAEACAALQGDVEDALGGLQDAFAEITSDPAAAQAALGEISTALSDSAAGLGNAEVKTAAEEAAAAIDDLNEQVGAALADPANADTTALQDASTAVQDKFGAISELCG